MRALEPGYEGSISEAISAGVRGHWSRGMSGLVRGYKGMLEPMRKKYY